MRALTLVSIFIVSFSTAPAHAQKSCPNDATAASTALWGTGTIKTGESVTGTHPCGRRISCIGGTPNAPKSRRCRWL
jgi:hypothetical protein